MYKANKRHLQPMLISNVQDLPEKHQQRLDQSWAGVFYRETFCRLKEEPFAVLYKDTPSRPNIPVNVLIGLDTLKSGFGWSDEELYDHYMFDLQVRYALGYHNLNEGEFDVRTLYNFRQRLSHYNQKHGVNLLVAAFEDITDQQINHLKVQTGMQRMDSTQIASNIMDMSRLQLLVEAIQRLYRILSEADQQIYAEEFKPYIKNSSGQYVYRIKGKEETHRNIQQVGESMVRMLKALKDGYGDESVFQVFQRFFDENFHLEAQVVKAKDNAEIGAGCLQSCDDLEASFRRKAQRGFKGYVANVAETCDPSNACQLITKLQVAPNCVEDSDLMIAALPDLKERTDLVILHTDGGYSSPEADLALQKQQIEQIPTAIKGSRPVQGKFGLAAYSFQIDEQDIPTQMTCPHQQVALIHWSRHGKCLVADFEPAQCETCPFHITGQCRATPGKRDRRYHLDFTLHESEVARRRQAMDRQKESGKNMRVAVEATMRTIKHSFPAGKLPVRGLFRVTCLMVGSALMNNMRSILRYENRKSEQERAQFASQKRKNSSTRSALEHFLSFFRHPFRAFAQPFAIYSPSVSC